MRCFNWWPFLYVCPSIVPPRNESRHVPRRRWKEDEEPELEFQSQRKRGLLFHHYLKAGDMWPFPLIVWRHNNHYWSRLRRIFDTNPGECEEENKANGAA